MNLLDTSEIPDFPTTVLVGYSDVLSDLNMDILSQEEREYLSGFSNEKRKAEFLTARHLFWKLVNEFGWDSDSITLKKEDLGKPYVESGSGKKFVSFSHSNDFVVCAISDSLDIGIDAESVDRKVSPAIVRRILSQNEWEIYGEENPIALWTMKEAAVKSLGTGLRTNLKDIELKKGKEGAFKISINKEKELQGVCFEALNHCIALAY